MQTAIAAIIVFGLIVFIHELGHFLVAKRVGILAREFAIGMGPKLFSFTKGETTYSIRALPIGGYVKMAGEDPEMYDIKKDIKVGLLLDSNNKINKIDLKPNSKYEIIGKVVDFDLEKELFLRLDIDGRINTYKIDESALIIKEQEVMQIAPLNRKFNGKTVAQRAATIFAGPLMNFLLAGLLFALIIGITGLPSNSNIVGEVMADNPAAAAGMISGDKIISINGVKVNDWQQLVAEISNKPNQTINIDVERNKEIVTLFVTAYEQSGLGKIGIKQSTVPAGFMSIVYGFKQTYELTILLISSLGQMVAGKIEADVAGPVGIIQIIGIQANEGLINLINLAAFLSLNLGIINLLPVPALDGGRLMFLGLEALRGKPVDPNKEGLIHFIGFALLMLLIFVVTYQDIARIFS